MVTLLLLFCLFGVLGVIFFRLGIQMWKLAAALFLILLVVFFCGGIAASAYEYQPADIVLIGKIVQHEAGNQSDLGRRLVCDTILNRVESEKFPNTVWDVVNQPGQYCLPEKFPPDDMYRLVAHEIYFRTNYEVLWYRTKRYHKYGTPIVVEGDHYFSGGK